MVHGTNQNFAKEQYFSFMKKATESLFSRTTFYELRQGLTRFFSEKKVLLHLFMTTQYS